jgi:DNA primase
MLGTVADIDLLNLVQESVRLHRVVKGGAHGEEWHGSCPFCGTGRDRFYVQTSGGEDGRALWYCRICEEGGDAIKYVMLRDGVSFVEALQTLALPVKSNGRQPKMASPAPEPESIEEPNWKWQYAADLFASRCFERLWSSDGKPALDYLRGRGFHDDTIREARFGFNDEEAYWEPSLLGLEETRDKPIWVPRGITIPWHIEGKLWRLNFRRSITAKQELAGEPKYIPLPGSPNCVYLIDDIVPGQPCLMVEGEFNAWSIKQEAGDLVSVIGLGAATHGRRIRWIAKIGTASIVLVALDGDLDEGKGDKSAQYWIDALKPRARRLRPIRKDPNDMLRDGAPIRAWVNMGISTLRSLHEPLSEPAMQPTTASGLLACRECGGPLSDADIDRGDGFCLVDSPAYDDWLDNNGSPGVSGVDLDHLVDVARLLRLAKTIAITEPPATGMGDFSVDGIEFRQSGIQVFRVWCDKTNTVLSTHLDEGAAHAEASRLAAEAGR